MRRKLVLLLAALCLLLAGCGQEKQGGEESAPVREVITAWPENVWTEGVPKPAYGVPDYTLSGGNGEFYAVFLRDVTREQGEAYLDVLAAEGFTELAGEREPAAAGVLMEKGGLRVSVSISGGGLGIYIARGA